jgi:adenine-specific DNA-methyltransferase
MDPLFLYLLSNAGRQLLSLSMRKYGDSLDKFEPNDLNKALVPTPEFFDTIPEGDIKKTIERIQVDGIIPLTIQSIFNKILECSTKRSNGSVKARSSALGGESGEGPAAVLKG